ncbi:MAG: hypothetical protein CMP10_18340 [Zetaproteobacteria bacterium]|nr:hypothetical protein [Pseudobdellovibrionaceae bacterium]|tara:strand:+ start:58 stop:477 length:420 start_codon:yes stop_codon:yes gene_type:complete
MLAKFGAHELTMFHYIQLEGSFMKKSLLAAAAAGIALGAQVASSEAEAAPSKKKKIECFGANGCSGKGACVVSDEQIKLTQDKYKGKYKKSVAIECKGNNACGAPNHLAWIPKKTDAECFKAGGFIFKKVKGKLVIQES